MSEPLQRPVHQDADLHQTNDQKVSQGNNDNNVTITVENHMSAPVSLAGQFDGRVLDHEGDGVADCFVELFFGPMIGVPVVVKETDHLGRFYANDMPPGFYSVRATLPNGVTVEQWNVRLDVGGECRPVLSLPQGAGRGPVGFVDPEYMAGVSHGASRRYENRWSKRN